MKTAILTLGWLSIAPLAAAFADEIDVKFVQVAPVHQNEFKRSADEDCAVVLIHGLQANPFGAARVAKANRSDWQRADSLLVSALADHADVVAFAYAQNVPVDRIAELTKLDEKIRRLRGMGYSEVVLVGHSAGGLIARQVVEDDPDCGVTKVVQVCSPNGGSSWSNVSFGVPESQEAFLDSLSSQSRADYLAKRYDVKIPDHVEFVCLVGQHHLACNLETSLAVGRATLGNLTLNADARGDGIVSSGGQWTGDLQDQGVPATALPITHFRVMQSNEGVAKIVELVRKPQPRLTESQVATARLKIFGSERAPGQSFAVDLVFEVLSSGN